jgi:conjugative transfer signal peptidase TraF
MSVVQGGPEGSGSRSAAEDRPAAVLLAESEFFKSPLTPIVRWIGYTVTALLLLGLPTAWICGYRVVTTSSVPRGVWRIHPGTVVKDGFVNICLPKTIALYGVAQGYLEHGICPGETESLMKRVIAVTGDTVDVSAAGIRVNGMLLANSRRRLRDDQGRLVRSFFALGTSAVPTGCYWLLGINGRSWDSRYYGCVPASGVLGVGEPAIVEAVPALSLVLLKVHQ